MLVPLGLFADRPALIRLIVSYAAQRRETLPLDGQRDRLHQDGASGLVVVQRHREISRSLAPISERSSGKVRDRVEAPMSGDHELRMHLPTELWQRLRTFADEMSMSPRVAGRVIIVAVLRDSWLLGNVRQPSTYVEKDGRAEAP